MALSQERVVNEAMVANLWWTRSALMDREEEEEEKGEGP
jgi:hypothetical protein